MAASRPTSSLARASFGRRLTLAAIGIVCAPLLVFVHELLGHGLATIALGAHFVRVTSIDESWSGTVPAAVARTIAAAGIASNLCFGALALLAFRALPRAPASLRYGLWFFGNASLFLGSGYLVTFSLLDAGDVGAAVRGLPFELAWRVALAALGVCVYRATLLAAGRAGAGATIAYVSMGTALTLAGLLNPSGALYGAAWSALGTFAAAAGFLFVAPTAAEGLCSPPLSVRFDPWAIVLGGVAAVALFGILAPGVPR